MKIQTHTRLMSWIRAWTIVLMAVIGIMIATEANAVEVSRVLLAWSQ